MNTLFGAAAVSARGHGMTSQRARDRLVATLRTEGVGDPRVLDVIRTTPRHLFLDEALAARAYENTALPIGLGQTISQPWVVARMTELILDADVAPKRVLEYVVVHELAHLKHRSHGEAFWAYLGSILPDFERPKGWLDTHQGSLDAAFLDTVMMASRSGDLRR